MNEKNTIEKILAGVSRKDKRLTSQFMSLIEDDNPVAAESLRYMIPKKRAYVLGVTGWPGVGKSTLVSCIAGCLLRQNKTVGIIAIDPSSPLSGGSFLGDRERMKSIDGAADLFIRSVSTRGHTGGIAQCSKAFIKVMELMGKDVIIVETVGVGQDQVSIMQMAHTILVVLIPGMGDYLQSLKAGILEIGDIFVINKADRQGADQTAAELRLMISMNGSSREWSPLIAKTIAMNGTGIEELMMKIDLHRGTEGKGSDLCSRQKSAAKSDIVEKIRSLCIQHIAARVDLDKLIEENAAKICEGISDAEAVAEEIIKESGIIRVQETGGRDDGQVEQNKRKLP